VAIFKKYQQEGIPQTQRYKYSDAVNIGNEPIIQKDIPVSVDSRTPTNNQFTRRTNDLGRIATLLTQKPGLKFIANRTALGVVQQNVEEYWDNAKEPKTDESPIKTKFKDKLKKLGKQALGGLVDTGKILATTLAQVPVNGTGTHFVRGDKEGLGNMLEIFTGPQAGESQKIDTFTVNLEPVKISDEEIQFSSDLLKFRFVVVAPTADAQTPIMYKILDFKAYLTALDDNFIGDWNSWKYNGRAENFYTYNGFERTVNIGFRIAAATKKEMAPLYAKMVELASTTAPTYTQEGTMKGSFVKVTIGDYLSRIPGIVTNVTYNWSTEYPWDIGYNSLEELADDQQQLPTVLDCTVGFTPIHSFVPQQGFVPDQENYFITRKTGNFDIAKQTKNASSTAAFGGDQTSNSFSKFNTPRSSFDLGN